MSLSLGSGPLAGHPGGAFNFDIDGAAPKHRIYFAQDPRRLRAVVDDAVVLDTTRARLLYETGIAPRIYAPLEDYALDLFETTETSTHCPFKGDASYWSLQVDGREVPEAVWYYPQPMERAPWLEGYAALYWEKADLWLAEDEAVHGHLRDPYHRVDVLESSRRVKVKANGTLIAETDRPKIVFETNLAPRAYLLRADVLPGILERSEKTSTCPYKGDATYWHVRTGDGVVEDGAWSYETPLSEAAPAIGHLSFDAEGIEIEVS
jgi:uncharacterized protein (DUF427 family)